MRARYESHCCALCTVALWSSAYVFTKLALTSFTPTALGFLRCVVAALTLLCLSMRRAHTLPRLRDWPVFLLSGILGFSLYLWLFNTGQASLTATTSCILISTAPLITAALAAGLLREKLRLLDWIALLLAFAGVLMLTLWKGALSVNSGVFWTLGAAFCISGYTLLQRRYAGRYGALVLTVWSFACAALTLSPFAYQAARQFLLAPWTHCCAVVFLGLFPSALAYLLWARALALAENTGAIAAYMFLTPLFSLLLGYIVLAEVPGPETFAGGAAILAALALLQRRKRCKMPQRKRGEPQQRPFFSKNHKQLYLL